MTKNDNPNRQPVIVAAIVASFLMFASGAAYRVLATRLDASGNATSIPPGALERLPFQISDWVGKDVPLDDAIVIATNTEAHIHRKYLRHNSFDGVMLYIAYGVKARDLMPHRPEVCYIGAGWTLTDKSSMELPLSDGMKLPCNTFEFSRGTLNTKKTVVLNYYIVDGQYCRDVSLLRSKAWRGSGKVGSVAQVQIVASVTANLTTDSATKIVYTFAAESAPSISRLFESTKESRRSDKDHFNANRMFGGTGSG